ncbi:YpfB family protein [Cytobacillus suaedae]|nr:YpfB family protein [Cytobacillus suaedae]
MKRFEGILFKLAVIQFIFLIIAQLLLLQSGLTPYISKIQDYEGVNGDKYTKTIETMILEGD